jgi:hypothetical protein
VNVCLRLWLTCSYCQPSAAAGFVHLEFSWPHAPFVSPVYSPTRLLQLQSLFFYLEFMWGGAPHPLSCGACHTSATVTSLPLSKVAGRGPPLLPSLAGLFIYSSPEGLPLPHSLVLSAPHPLWYMSFLFFFSCLLFSLDFSLFYPGLGSVCPGDYADLALVCLLEYRVPLSSPGGLLLPSRTATGIWRWESPPRFSV